MIELIGMAGNHLLVKRQIRSCAEEWYCLRPEAGHQLFSDKIRQCNNLYGKKPPPRQYQQRFRNSSLQEEGSDVIDQILAPSTTQSVTQQLLHTILVPAQDAPFALILWCVAKIIYLSQEQDQFAIKSSNLFLDRIHMILRAF